MKDIFRSLRTFLRNNCLGLVEKILKPLIVRFGTRISVTYDAASIKDGSGAQIHRIFSIRALAERYSFGFIHEPIKQITVHPFDSFQSNNKMKIYIDELNYMFGFESTVGKEGRHDIFLSSLTFKSLIKIIFLSKVKSLNLLLHIKDGHFFADLFPDIYKKIVKLNNFNKYDHNRKDSESNIRKIVIHYRWGVGGKVIYPGQRISRELDSSYYLEAINKIIEGNMRENNFELEVLTDAPKRDFVFTPLEEQMDVWKGTPGFVDGKLLVKGIDIEGIFSGLGIKVTISSGGDPISAIVSMSESDYFIMAKSSLSYIGALFSLTGEVIFPPSFWHGKIEQWQSSKVYALRN